MKTIELQLPDEIEIKENELLMIIASKLYEDGRLSLGQASKLAGIPKDIFIEMLGNYGVSVFSKSTVDLHSDIANA